jgi:hypothetical protein
MKTINYLNPISSSILICLFLFSIQLNSQSQSDSKEFTDAYFPKKNKTMLTVGTGIPYIGIAEYSYGFTDKFSVGLLAGTTTIVPGYGLRIKGVLFQKSENFRVFIKAPILYYPKTKDLGGEPWVLTWPSLNAEWTLDSGIRISGGIGLVAAACANDLLGIEHPHTEPHNISSNHEHEDNSHHTHAVSTKNTMVKQEGFMGDVWNTIQTGMTVPISKKLIFQSEFALVLDGNKVANEAWVGRYPVIVFLGISYNF